MTPQIARSGRSGARFRDLRQSRPAVPQSRPRARSARQRSRARAISGSASRCVRSVRQSDHTQSRRSRRGNAGFRRSPTRGATRRIRPHPPYAPRAGEQGHPSPATRGKLRNPTRIRPLRPEESFSNAPRNLAKMKVLTNARVYRYDPASRAYSVSDGMILDGPRIADVESSRAGGGVETIDLDGATVLPAFADCHVHLTDTGYFLGARNLNGVRSYEEFSQAVARLPRADAVLAGQYDESTWRDGGVADARALDHAFSDTR